MELIEELSRTINNKLNRSTESIEPNESIESNRPNDTFHKIQQPMLRSEFTKYGNYAQRLHIHMITNVLRENEADQLFERLKMIQYNSQEESRIRINGMLREIPRQQVAFGDKGTSYHFSGISVPSIDWSSTDDTFQAQMGRELHRLCGVVSDLAGFKFNFVLVNRYRNERDSVGYHSDDEKELGTFPVIAGLSLGQTRRMNFRSKLAGTILALDVRHNSLYTMYHPTNHCWFHEIPKSTKGMGERISLTFRHLDILEK